LILGEEAVAKLDDKQYIKIARKRKDDPFIGSKLGLMTLLFFRASRGKEFESDPFIGNKLGLN